MWIDIERIIHSIKTGLACLIGFSIIKALHAYLLFDQWLIVTILVVMCAQISVGGIFYKSLLRLIGTTIGSLLAAFAILYFGDDNLAFAGTIAFAGMLFSYIATSRQNYSDVGTLGAVTTAIILINPNPTLSLTAERFIEISIGILIATLISQFILPIHARTHLRRSQAQALRLLGQFYRNATTTPRIEKEKMAELDENIVRSISTQRKLANEAKRELLGSKFQPAQFKQLLEGEKHILRDTDFLYRLYGETTAHQFLQDNAAWKKFNQEMAEVFNKIAEQVEKMDHTTEIIAIPSVDALKEETPHDDTLPFAHTLFFCLGNITQQLQELVAATR